MADTLPEKESDNFYNAFSKCKNTYSPLFPKLGLLRNYPRLRPFFHRRLRALSVRINRRDADDDEKKKGRDRGGLPIASLISRIMESITDISKHRNVVTDNRAKRIAKKFKWKRQYYCGNRRYFRNWIMDLFGSMFQNSIVLDFDIVSYSSIYCKPGMDRKFRRLLFSPAFLLCINSIFSFCSSDYRLLLYRIFLMSALVLP